MNLVYTSVCCVVSHVRLFATLWTVAHQAFLSMEFSWQEYWSGLPFPPPGDLLDSGIEPVSLALASRFLSTAPPGKSCRIFFTEETALERSGNSSKSWSNSGTGTPTSHQETLQPRMLLGCVCAQSLQLCLTLCDPMGCRPPGPSVHGILQARVLVWVAMPAFEGSSQPRN